MTETVTIWTKQFGYTPERGSFTVKTPVAYDADLWQRYCDAALAAYRSFDSRGVARVTDTPTGWELVVYDRRCAVVTCDTVAQTLVLEDKSGQDAKLFGMHRLWQQIGKWAVNEAKAATEAVAHAHMEHDPHGDYERHMQAAAKAAIAMFHLVFGIKQRHQVPRIILKALWSKLDREVIRYGVKCFGNGMTMEHYTRIWRSLEAFREADRLAPGVMPLWFEAVDPMAKSTSLLSDVRQRWGFTPRAWRFLLKMKPSYTRQIAHYYHYNTHFLNQLTLPQFMDFLAEVGTLPKLKPFREAIYSLTTLSTSQAAAVVMRACFQESQKRPAATFHRDAMSLVLDWVRDDDFALDANQKKLGWAYFWRKQAEWHQEVARRPRYDLAHWQYLDHAAADTYSMPHHNPRWQWESLVGAQVVQDVQVTPLTDSDMLSTEGREMDHCVGGYTEPCRTGRSRIFGLKAPDGERSTLELSLDYRGWFIAQNRGRTNGNPSTVLHAAANALARLYNQAWKEADSTHRPPTELPPPALPAPKEPRQFLPVQQGNGDLDDAFVA